MEAKTHNGHKAFGKELRRLREHAGMTQQQVADRVGISREGYGEIERGDTKRPADTTLYRLSEVLEFSLDWAHALMENRPPLAAEAELWRIVALPTAKERLDALEGSAPELRRAVHQLLSDAMSVVVQQLTGEG